MTDKQKDLLELALETGRKLEELREQQAAMTKRLKALNSFSDVTPRERHLRLVAVDDSDA